MALMRHQSDCREDLRIVRGNCLEQLERCWPHHLDSHIRKAMSARDTEEEDQDSDYPDLVQDSKDEDDECNKEEEDEGEDEGVRRSERFCFGYGRKSSSW
jgi:hypothetical protein